MTLVKAFAIALLAGLGALLALEAGWGFLYIQERDARIEACEAIRGPADICRADMGDWKDSNGIFIWIIPEFGPGSGFNPHGPPYPEPLGVIYGR